MSWWGAVIGALGSYLSADAASDQPRSNMGHSRLVPSANTSGHIDRIMQEYMLEMDRRKNAGPQYFPGKPPGGGPSGQTTGMIDNLWNADWMNTGYGGSLRDYTQGQLGKVSNLQQQAFDAASGFNPRYYDDLIQQGANFSNAGIEDYIQSRMRGSGGGGGGTPIRIDNEALGLGEATNDYDRSVLAGDFLSPDSNPWISEYADVIRQQGMETLVPQAKAAAAGARRYGSGAFAQQENEAYADINDDITGLYYSNYENERGRQEGAAGRLSNLDQSKVSAGASMANAQTAASASRANARESALASLLGTYGNQQLQGLGIASELARAFNSDSLDAIGLMQTGAAQDNAWQAALIDGMNKNLGMELGSRQSALQGNQQADAQRAAGANSRYLAEMDRFNYERDFQMNNYLQMLDVLGRFGSQFGTQETNNIQSPPNINPWANALAGGFTGYQAGYNSRTGRNQQAFQNQNAQDLWTQMLYGQG